MKAIRIHRFGGTDVLAYEEAPMPAPRPGELLVQVRAAGVNPVDWKVRSGQTKDLIAHALPLVLGWDLSGVVAAIHPPAGGFDVGDEVFGRPDITRDGAYAEYIAVRTEEVAKKPVSLDHIHAAAVPLAGLTAWQTLIDAPEPYRSAALQRGQTLLVHGAGGGVGSLAVQIAKWRGARVVATASERHIAFLKELGVDQVVDYEKQDFETVIRNVDVVLDTIGGETQRKSWSVLNPGGTLVSIVSPPSEELAAERGMKGAYVFVQPNAAHLIALTTLVDAGKLRPIVSAVFPLSEAAKAHELGQAGHVRGKIVLDIR